MGVAPAISTVIKEPSAHPMSSPATPGQRGRWQGATYDLGTGQLTRGQGTSHRPSPLARIPELPLGRARPQASVLGYSLSCRTPTMCQALCWALRHPSRPRGLTARLSLTPTERQLCSKDVLKDRASMVEVKGALETDSS